MTEKTISRAVSEKRPRRTKSIRVPIGLGADPHVIFLAMLRREGIEPPVAELQFASPRRWRFDYSWRIAKRVYIDPSNWRIDGWRCVALEVEGGIFVRGRHSRGKGMLADMEKYNEAALRGWTVLRVTPKQLPTLETITLIKRALHADR